VLFGGLGALGFGALLYVKGENRRSTTIRPLPGGAMVSQRIRF
jgi:hypothetical protein